MTRRKIWIVAVVVAMCLAALGLDREHTALHDVLRGKAIITIALMFVAIAAILFRRNRNS